MMPYVQFKKAWLTVVDVRAELRLRGERFNRLLPNPILTKKLAMLVNMEEKQEAMTLLEANNTLSDEIIAAQRRELVNEANLLARVTLAEALDAAGQVYVFGKGAYQRFDNEPREPDFVEFMEYGIVRDLWHQRVCPPSSRSIISTLDAGIKDASPAASANKSTKRSSHSKTNGQVTSRKNQADTVDSSTNKSDDGEGNSRPSHSRTKLEASARAFSNRQVSKATAFLWGKRVKQVACGTAVAYALTDAGEVFCWGGNKRQWRYFYDEATADNGFSAFGLSATEEHGNAGSASKSDNSGAETTTERAHRDTGLHHRPLTTRSEMLRLFALPSQVAESHEVHDQLGLRVKYAKVFEKPIALVATEEDRCRRLQLVGRYYGFLDPMAPPAAGKAPVLPTIEGLMETVEPELDVDDLSLSLFLRGVKLAKPTRMLLLETLGECLELEIECVGDQFHEHFKQQDQIARRYRKERREKPLMRVVTKANALWFELSQLRENMLSAEKERLIKGEEEYNNMKRKITYATQKLKRRAREGHSAVIPADSNRSNNNNNTSSSDSRNEEESLLYINGLTSRGPALRFFNGTQALQNIAVGSRHALAIHSSGKLYTWGVGSFGRLGGDQLQTSPYNAKPHENSDSNSEDTEDFPVDSWHRDVHSAQIISAVCHVRFRAISCGFGHSLALSTDGTVYAWGSATHGKLGIGPVKAKESFTLAPIVLSSLISSGVRVRKIACGPSHSALLTTDGALFVWGCGDGGRLGLGDERDVGEDRVPRNGGQLRVIPTPTRVTEPFGHDNLVEVACGAAHTVVLTALHHSISGQPNSGGCVYVAGSNHALDKFTPQFTHVEIKDGSSAVMMIKVGCGPAHTALVSTEGELYTWGKNVGGSTGHAVSIPRIAEPTRVGCMFERPQNLCLDESTLATQSSQNATALPEYALGGEHAARAIQRRQKARRASNNDRSQLSSAAKFAQTQQEMCPFWQAALPQRCHIVSIRVVLVTATTEDTNSTARSTLSTKRQQLSAGSPKYVIMVSDDAFDPDLRGKQSLAKARNQSVHISLSGAMRSVLIWVVPADTFGTYIRIQLESSSGVGMLSLDRVEVLGSSSEQYVGPRVSDVVCAEAMTVAICTPLSRREELREKFQRAVRADRASVGILAQLETFHPFVREEENETRAEDALYAATLTAKTAMEKREVAAAIAALEAKRRAKSCALCRPQLPCVICEVEKQVQAAKQKLSVASISQAPVMVQYPKKPMNGRSKYPGSAVTPPLSVARNKRPHPAFALEALCAEFLALDTRSKEEEEEAQRLLELELMDPAALAREKEEEEAASRHASGLAIANPVSSHAMSTMSQLISKMLITARLLGRKGQEKF
ncbi:unnamed protein product [Phytophthora fragariaefolia]|uniref:Unnamed protein product n=1 Tax=Phytophthora fragariaefolia TaxID=1490495 RepID=A0A9W6TPC5_9STRA|nr:unnamed protein product [Phytophthora fragariaefolia]